MYTAEFVTPKHPDKMCDRISDAILDECLRQNPEARAAVEVLGGHRHMQIIGEIRGAKLDKDRVARIVEEVAGTEIERLSVKLVQQSAEIANGVDKGGAGDQGIMRGYAVRDTENFMPKEYELARDLCRTLYEKFPYDGKTQVTLDEDMQVLAIVASFQNTSHKELLEAVHDWVIKCCIIDPEDTDKVPHIYANPAGDWNVGGFEADTGLTGRKLMVDNYGPRFAIGGGAFSGKDATKVDRSAAYMARRIAVDVLEKYHFVKEVEVQLAYAIGVAHPVDVTLKADGLPMTNESNILSEYDLTPRGIIKFLDLQQPIYSKTAEWGHFGNGFNWK